MNSGLKASRAGTITRSNLLQIRDEEESSHTFAGMLLKQIQVGGVYLWCILRLFLLHSRLAIQSRKGNFDPDVHLQKERGDHPKMPVVFHYLEEVTL